MQTNKVTPGSNLRWSSSRFMLPEHIEQLEAYHKHKSQNVRPILDDQLLHEFQGFIRQSYQEKSQITLTLFGHYEHVKHTGIVCHIDNGSRKIRLELDNDILSLNIDDILDITTK